MTVPTRPLVDLRQQLKTDKPPDHPELLTLLQPVEDVALDPNGDNTQLQVHEQPPADTSNDFPVTQEDVEIGVIETPQPSMVASTAIDSRADIVARTDDSYLTNASGLAAPSESAESTVGLDVATRGVTAPAGSTADVPLHYSRGAYDEEYPFEQPAAVVTIVNCRGVLVGNDGHQRTHFEYHVAGPELDLSELLGRRGVADALLNLSTDPDNPEALARAEHALAAGRFLFSRDWLEDLDERNRSVRGQGGTNDITVIVRNSEGVMVGDHSQQQLHFDYFLETRVNAIDLFAAHPELIEFVVAKVRGVSSQHSLTDSLNPLIAAAVLSYAEDRPDRGVQMAAPDPGEMQILTGVDSGVVGRSDQDINVGIEVTDVLYDYAWLDVDLGYIGQTEYFEYGDPGSLDDDDPFGTPGGGGPGQVGF